MDIVILAGILITAATLPPVLWQLRKHPRGLVVLFMAEMWERFSYYGMRGLLIFYLTQHFLFDDDFAQGQYGAYTSLVYLLPLVGGFLADKYLGTRKAIVFGALLLVAGHLAMAFEGAPAKQVLIYEGQKYDFVVDGRGDGRKVSLVVDGAKHAFSPAPNGGLEIKDLPAGAALPTAIPKGAYTLGVENRSAPHVAVMYLALSLIIMGVGFLKPNISTIVGQLYPEGDPRRDPGFTLYYYGINLGAFWAAILCGFLGQKVGWWAGFGLAGIGMLAGLIMFQRGRASLEGKGEAPDAARLAAPIWANLSREKIIYIGGFLGVFAVWALLTFDASVRTWTSAAIAQFPKPADGSAPHLPLGLSLLDFFAAVGTALAIGSMVILGYIFWYMGTKLDRMHRDRMMLALLMIFASVLFWTLFEQAGSSLNQFADRNIDLRLTADFSMQASQTQSFNSGYILLFAPLFSIIWAILGKRGADPTTPMKFGLALIQVGLGFLVLVWGATFAGDDYKVPVIFLAMAYLLHTTGELCLSPVGLSMITKLSAAAVVSTMMAIWFLASAWAQWLGGLLAQATAAETVAGAVLDPAASLRTYTHVFQQVGFWAIGIGIVLCAASPWLQRMSHGADQTLSKPH
ncbi:MAG: oligopeptide:H+ symporter [Caulobacterales bacterium]